MWWFTRLPADGQAVVVRDINQAATSTWTLTRPDAQQSLSVSPVGEGQALVYSYAFRDEMPAPVSLIDLATGDLIWDVTVPASYGHDVRYSVTAQDLPGTDYVAVYSSAETVDAISLTLVDRKSGLSEIPVDLGRTSWLFTSGSGNVYVVDWATHEFSRVAGIRQLDVRLWTKSFPSQVGGD